MSAMQAHPHSRLPPVHGMAADWVRQIDSAETAMYEADPSDPYAQRHASRLLTSLFVLEHQMRPKARRLAREFVWLRDHPGKQLPAVAAHAPDKRPEEPLCLCLLCREEWAACRCNVCRLTRLGEQARATIECS